MSIDDRIGVVERQTSQLVRLGVCAGTVAVTVPIAALVATVAPAIARGARDAAVGATPVFSQVRIDDPAGDAAGAAADVTSITATSYTDGTINIVVTFANRGSVGPGDQLVVSFDYDRGAFVSADARLEARRSAATVLYGKGRICPPLTSCSDVFWKPVSAASGGGSYAVTLNTGDLRRATNSSLGSAEISVYTTAFPTDGTPPSPPYRRDYTDWGLFRFASSPSNCVPYIVLASRGSGERHGTLGSPNQALVDTLKRRLGRDRVFAIANPYPAIGGWIDMFGALQRIARLGAYHDSVNEGKRWLAGKVRELRRTCRTSQIILAGYSQGAQVTGDVVQRDLTTDDRRGILGTVLFGDPYFNGNDHAAGRGGYLHGRHGRLAWFGLAGTRLRVANPRPRFRSGFALSYCHRNDTVCQDTSVLDFLRYRLSQHSNYGVSGEPQAAANALANLLSTAR